MRTTRVLFNWKPRNLDHFLKDRLMRRLSREGWATHPWTVQVQDPEQNTAIFPQTCGWHHDIGPHDLRFIVWSNARPTEVRFADGLLLEARDGDVILIDNDEVEHRAPADQSGRWLVRTGLVVDMNLYRGDGQRKRCRALATR